VTYGSLVNSAGPREKVHLFREGFYTLPLGRNLAFRVYADSRPHNLETARLQKGLVLMFNEKEIIEEGMGFGVPVAIFSDKTYFSGSAQVSSSEDGKNKTILKHFFMDTVSRKSWKGGVYVDNPLYKLFSGSLASTYRDYPASRRVIFPLIKLRNKVGVRTHFTKVESRGEVTVTYKIKRNGLDITADLTKLNKNHCRKVLLLNEQGSTFFRKFFDSDSLSFTDEKIGAWDLIKVDWACFSNLDNTLSFCLRGLPNCRLFRGREHIRGRLAWAGMGYELSPNLDFFNYKVQIHLEKMKNA